MAQHGEVTNLFKIYNAAGSNLELTRPQAIVLMKRLREVIYPRAPKEKKR